MFRSFSPIPLQLTLPTFSFFKTVVPAGPEDILSVSHGHAIFDCPPGVAELADALDSKSSGT